MNVGRTAGKLKVARCRNLKLTHYLELKHGSQGVAHKTKQLGAQGEEHFQPNGGEQAYWLRKSWCGRQRR